MSRKILKTYKNFSRVILREFLPEKELQQLDKKYNNAKIARVLRRMKNGQSY